MTPKHALCSAILAVPLIIAGAGPSAADMDAEFGFGFGSPYYAYDPYYGYGLADPYVGFYGGEFDEDEVDEVIEPAAAPAEPAPCVKTNVKNFKNACPN